MNPPSKGATHIRVAYHLPRRLVADLQALAGRLKAKAIADGQPAPSMSEIVASALRAELKRRH